MKILIIDSDSRNIQSLCSIFQYGAFNAEINTADNGADGTLMVEKYEPELLLIDSDLSDKSGCQIISEVRIFSNIPIVMLSNRYNEEDLVRCLECGAEDYIVRPFRQMEFLARIKNIVRYKHREGIGAIHYGLFCFEPSTCCLKCGRRKILLTPIEGRIFNLLLENSGHVVPYSKIAERVWGKQYEDITENLRIYVGRIKKKLRNTFNHRETIINKPSIGYMFNKERV